MHDSAIDKMKAFVNEYLKDYFKEPLKILEIGSKVIYPQKSQKFLFENGKWKYIGLDIEPGENVDIVPKDPFDWQEINNNTFDVIICSQVFEHIFPFWVTAFEMGRVLKEGGLICIIVPSTGDEHRFPYDTFRYFPDGLSLLCDYIGFLEMEVYRQSGNLQYEDGSDYNKDSCIIMKKPIFSEMERKNFIFRNKLHKMLLKGCSIENIKDINIKENELSDIKSCLYKEEPKNAFLNLEKERLSKISKFFVRKRIIKACIPILINNIFGKKVAKIIFKIYPKMEYWS